MRICVAVPPISDFYFSRDRMSSLGARTVLEIARSLGHECVMLDFPRSVKKTKSAPLPDELGYLAPYMLEETGPVSFFTRYQRLGPGPGECAKSIVAAAPDIVLIACFAFAYADNAIELADAVRAAAPDVDIAVGGAGASALPERFLAGSAIRYVLTGEAEVNLPLFLEELAKPRPRFDTIPNITWKADGSVQKSSVVGYTQKNDLRWVYESTERRKGRTRITTSLTRGCPRSCSFCSNYLCHGRSFRKLPAPLAKQGLSRISPREGVHLNFEDDNVLADRSYFREILAHAGKHFVTPTFSAENGLDAGLLDEDFMKELIKLGFSSFNLSLASTDDTILKGENRKQAKTQITGLTRQAQLLGVPSVTYFICGLSGDTPSSVRDNLLFVHGLQSRIGISLFYPVPGLPGFENTSVFDNTPSSLACGSSAYPWTESLTTRQMVTAFRLARFLNLVDNPSEREYQKDLIEATVRHKRLHTWSKNRSSLIPVASLDEELARDVIVSACC